MVKKKLPSLISGIPTSAGFSLVEVVVAAVVLLTLLLSTNRALILGMASTQRSASRSGIESEILNDIEAIQATDSNLSSDTQAGCATNSGSGYLKTKVEQLNPVPTGSSWSRSFDTTDPNILIATYSFNIPGASASGAQEKRIVELNPSFLSQCLK